MSVVQLAEWLEGSSVGVLIRESLWGFQIVVAIHILGLIASVGMLIWFDLRLLGAGMPNVPVATVYRRLAPWMLIGFAVMFLSGGMLLAGFATKAYGNPYFRVKCTAFLLAGANAVIYHRVTQRGIARWNTAVRPPLPVRTAGLISIALWAVVIMAGRMMSYTMF